MVYRAAAAAPLMPHVHASAVAHSMCCASSGQLCMAYSGRRRVHCLWSHSCSAVQIIKSVAIDAERPAVASDTPPQLRRLIRKCWEQVRMVSL